MNNIPSRFTHSESLKALMNLKQFMDLVLHGYRFSLNATLLKTVLEPETNKDEQWFVDIESYAREQKADDYSYLFEIGVVRLWSILESFVDDLALFLLKDPNSLNSEQILKLKGPLVEFLQASDDERAEFILELLYQETKAKLQPGVGRFEVALNVLGMGGPVGNLTRKSLLELSQVRNVIVHKGSRVDKRLLQKCPWLKWEVGNKLRISPLDFQIYFQATHCYFCELSKRSAQDMEQQGAHNNEGYKGMSVENHRLLAIKLEEKLEASYKLREKSQKDEK